MATDRRTTIILRALRLRCPNCGGGHVFAHWLRMVEDCPNCGFSLASGNRVGANLLNLVASEVTLFIAMAVVILRSWPNPPWTLLQYGAPLLMALAPLALFPFSKMLFVAFDLAMHPEAQPDAKVHGVGG